MCFIRRHARLAIRYRRWRRRSQTSTAMAMAHTQTSERHIKPGKTGRYRQCCWPTSDDRASESECEVINGTTNMNSSKTERSLQFMKRLENIFKIQ